MKPAKVIILLSLTWFFNPLQAVINGDIYVPLMDLVETHLNKSYVDFDTWTREMSLILEKEQQERLAWNVRWLKILDEKKSLVKMQHQLEPSNPLKLRLWLSFYWSLRRSGKLSKILLANFALELRVIQRNHPEIWSHHLQNMWQSLPRFLRILSQGRWLCLQHKREMFYVTAGYHLELGANDNCSVWRTRKVREDYLLRLVNFCDEELYFFINMVEDDRGSHQLLRPTRYMNNTFCVLRGVAHFRETSQATQTDVGCQWQLIDCSYLPSLLGKNKVAL